MGERVFYSFFPPLAYYTTPGWGSPAVCVATGVARVFVDFSRATPPLSYDTAMAEKRYSRNHFCEPSRYIKCLDRFATSTDRKIFNDPKVFNCAGCEYEHVHLEAGDLPVQDIMACIKLVYIAIHPDFQNYCRMYYRFAK